jgi:alkylated DNA repair dioxygenase AlkB
MRSPGDMLFSIETFLPSGFSYDQDFITVDEEHYLLDVIKKLDLRPMNFQGFEAKRKTMSFGYDYSFDNRKLSRGKEIPNEFKSLISRVAKRTHVSEDHFAEVLVTEYPVGSVINWHRDAPPFEIIAGISLLSDCIFKLRPHEKAKQSRQSVISFRVSPRSLYVMQGEARREWQHSTAPVKSVRYSITLRTLKHSIS